MLDKSLLNISIKGCFLDNRLQEESFSFFQENALQCFNEIKTAYHDKKLPALSVIFDQDQLMHYQQIAQTWQRRFKHVVLFGTGGSSLGAQTCIELYQTRVSKSTTSPYFHFMDNIDSHTFTHLLEGLDLQTTGFLVISKSGTTAETLCQFLSLMSVFKNNVAQDQVIVITEPKDSPLRRLAVKYKYQILDHPSQIGGRFSVFSIVGMLPALIAGVNVQEILDGAQQYLAQEMEELTCHTVQGAALNYAYYKQFGCSQTVVMPYIDRLSAFALWFRQLWAESLGKEKKGITPINALGTVDQHSQLQLYLGGPSDKFFTLIMLDSFSSAPEVSTEDPELFYLNRHTLADLMRAEQNATAATLIRQGCPTRIITLNHLDERTLGALLIHYMLETMITAKLLEIDAFDQPAVEEGKILTREYLSRKAS
jgi:glucose-6-phosphate isomerase